MPHATKMGPMTLEIENKILENLQQFKCASEKLFEQEVISWENFIIPLEKLWVQFNKQWFLFQITHFLSSSSVENNFLDLYNSVQTRQIEFYQNPKFLLAIQKLEQTALTSSQVATIADLKKTIGWLAGTLTASQKTEFIRLKNQLSSLSYQFIKNIQETSKNCQVFITRENSLAGIPSYLCEIAAEKAHNANLKGWSFQLNEWTYRRIIQHASRRSIRKLFYNTRQTIASNYKEDSIYDNAPLIEQISNIRLQISNLLGFSNVAQYLCYGNNLDYQGVYEFFHNISANLQPFEEELIQKIQQFAFTSFEYSSIEPWDVEFCVDQYLSNNKSNNNLLKSRNNEHCSFSFTHVWSQILWLTSSLFNLQFKKIENSVTWDNHVLCYSVYRNNVCLGQIFADLYERANKRPGTSIHFSKLEMDQVTIVLSTHFMPPFEKYPSLLTYEELFILFREFGKALDILLTQHASLSLVTIKPIQSRQAQVCLENLAKQSEILQLCTVSIPGQEQQAVDYLQFSPISTEGKAQNLLKKFQQAHFDLQAKMSTTKLHYKNLCDILNAITHSGPVEKSRSLNHAIDLFLDDNNSQALEFYYALWSHVTFAKNFSMPTMLNLQKFVQKMPAISQPFKTKSHQKDLEDYLKKSGLYIEQRNPILHSYHLRKKQTHLTENAIPDKKNTLKLNS